MSSQEPGSRSAHAESGAAPGVLEKAMTLLEVFSRRGVPLSFTELLRESALPRATLHRILATLVRERLLRHDPHTRTYQLGFRLLELAHQVWSGYDLRVAAQDHLVHLRDQLGEAVQLAILDGDSVVLIGTEEGRRAPFAQARAGERVPMHATALGKAILAHLDLPLREELIAGLELPALTSATIQDRNALRNDLDLTRTRGYAVENSEHRAGFVGVAAPVLDIEGRAVGAIGTLVPASRIGTAQAHGLSAPVIGAARAVSHNAGGAPTSLQPAAPPDGNGNATVTCVREEGSLLAEGPMWSSMEGALYWVDILTPTVHRLEMASGRHSSVMLGAMVSAAVPKASGGLLVASAGGLMSFDMESRQLEPFCHPEAGRPGNRYNDAKCDRMGRLWVGTVDMAAAPNRGRLYRVDPDGTWQLMDEGFSVANGLGWSPDNSRMYFIDSGRRTIYTYDFDLRAGTIANRRALVTLDAQDGSPDGMTVDDEGCLWVAIWDAWRLSRYSPDGEELARIRLPVPRPTSCCFGGERLDTLYVTSAAVRLSTAALKEAPLSGSLFSVQVPGVRGLPQTVFAA